MPQRATHFVEGWITINVVPIVIAIDGAKPDPVNLALQCREDAAKAGIPETTIIEAYGSLEDRMHRALKLGAFLSAAGE